MDAYEIIEAIRTAEKKTPVKAYIKAQNRWNSRIATSFPART